LMYSLMSMSRSHEESAIKSKRSAASWENRRRQAIESKKPVTGQTPHWLSLSDDKQKFVVNEEFADIIRSIYAQSIAGVGRRKIATDLNANGVKPFGPRASKWHTSYIANLLSNRIVIGEYQPTKGGEPEGEPISDYYPIIVSEKVFYQAQTSQKSRWNNNSGGRKGVKFSNLFTGMCKCLECDDTYRYMSRGKASLFLCDKHHMRSGCQCSKRWRYHDVENVALLILADEIDWFTALGGHTNNKHKLEEEITSLTSKLDNTEKQVERFAELFSMSDGAMLTDARQRYMKAMTSADDLRRAIENKEAELRIFTPVQHNLDRLNRILFDLHSETDEHKLYELRAEINAIFRDAGLKLYFNESGVFYYVKSTKQKGLLLIEGMEKELSLIANLEITERMIKGLAHYKKGMKKIAVNIPDDDLLQRLTAEEVESA